jgi:hypothetical protein
VVVAAVSAAVRAAVARAVWVVGVEAVVWEVEEAAPRIEKADHASGLTLLTLGRAFSSPPRSSDGATVDHAGVS